MLEVSALTALPSLLAHRDGNLSVDGHSLGDLAVLPNAK